MYHKCPLFFILFGYVSCLVCYAAEPVEIYYFSKQQAYRVSGVEGGKPKLEEYTGEAVNDFNGSRNESWWVKGELPRSSGWANMFSSFGTKRVANAYRDRYLPVHYSMWAVPGRLWVDEKEIEKHAGALYVLGWVKDGRITRYAVTGISSDAGYSGTFNLELLEEEFGGYPLLWVVEDGKVVSIESSEWERAFLDSKPIDMTKLLEFRDDSGRSALHYAAAYGDRILAEKLLEADKRLVRVSDNDKISALSCAAENGRAGVVELLLDFKASLSDGPDDVNSVVRKAARSGHFETLKLLAPGKPRGSEGKWHYSWAASDALAENYEDIAMYLIEQGADFTIDKERRGDFVLSKFSLGYPELGFRLLEKFDMDATISTEGYNLMHSVASYADVPLLVQVRSFGVDLAQKTEKGMYPVDHAVGLGNVDAICWFLDNGGRYELDGSGIDPLKHAIRSRQLSSVECLIGYGYDVNREVGPGLTSLMYAMYLREFEIARKIADAGGVVLLDSPHIDVIVLRLVAGDESELLGKVLDQGWAKERKLFGSLSLGDCVDFYGASSIEEALKQRSWVDESVGLVRLSEVDQKPAIVAAMQVAYPLALQEKFGAQTVAAKVGVAASGVPLMVEVRTSPEQEELVNVVEQAVYTMRFTPAIKDGVEVPVSLLIRVPLTVDFDPASVFSMSDVSEKPVARTMATPLYPYEMQLRRVKGRVVVEFVIMPDGSVRGVKVATSTHEVFERHAVLCVEQSTWMPATLDGKPVACRARIPIEFKP